MDRGQARALASCGLEDFGAENSLRQMFHPMGFPLLIETNSQRILDLAAEMWVQKRSLGHQRTACLLQLNLCGTRCSKFPRVPRVQQCGLLTYFNADEDHFAVCDAVGGYAVGWVSEAAADQGLYVQQYFLRSITMLMLAQESQVFSTVMGNGGRVLQMPWSWGAVEPASTGTHG